MEPAKKVIKPCICSVSFEKVLLLGMKDLRKYTQDHSLDELLPNHVFHEKDFLVIALIFSLNLG